MSHWGIITAGDVEAEQARTLSSAQTTDQAVQACTTIDVATKQQWATFLAALTKWCKTPVANIWAPWLSGDTIIVTGDTGDTMMAYETQLQAWQQKVAGLCKSTPPGLPEFDPNPAGSQATQWLRWGAVAIGFAATAYVVGTVASFIPRQARAAEPKLRRSRSRRKMAA